MAHTYLLRVLVLNVPLEQNLSFLLKVVHLQIVDDADLVAPFFISTEKQITSKQWLITVANFREAEIFLRLATILIDGSMVSILNLFKALLGLTVLILDRRIHVVQQVTNFRIIHDITVATIVNLADGQ